MSKPTTVKIFAVEDDPVYSKFLKYVLDLNPDFEVELFENGKDCLAQLHKSPNIITLDYSLPDLSGEEILKRIKSIDPSIHVIIISGQENISTAVNLLKQGAYDYITKDEETKDRLLNSLNNALKNVNLLQEINNLKKEISIKYNFESSIIGSSTAIKKTFDLLSKAIKTNITVSITGETGTGKELAAKAIHYNSNRKKGKFMAVNIAAIPKELLESELFGYEKGAFTGAVTRRIGKFEDANDGTLFLDEIGEMDINLQAKLLRVLQEKELSRIGGNDVIKINPRIIVATHKDLALEVSNGNFREDLYYRLLGLPIEMPPLRDRGNDIIIIANKILEDFCIENELDCNSISKEAKEKLITYAYPGNVRELKSIIELAAVMGSGKEIKADDISFKAIKEDGKIIFEELTLKEYESKIINHFMDKFDGNVLKVARILNIGKSTIYRHLKKDNYEGAF
ncbi:MAG: sigma-54 dependent transcriptional regulator [Cyclobacteriaceae bacterium]|nr:sigma-54 dependent transcriptional regulator [Cyclobacteriaceae bacterium]